MNVPNTTALIFAMGYQGGTVHQVAADLGVTTSDILNADEERMGELLRLAQAFRNKRASHSDVVERVIESAGGIIKALTALKPGHYSVSVTNKWIKEILRPAFDELDAAMTAYEASLQPTEKG